MCVESCYHAVNFDPCDVGVIRHRLTQMLLLCKYNCESYIIGLHKNTLQCYVNPTFQFVRTHIHHVHTSHTVSVEIWRGRSIKVAVVFWTSCHFFLLLEIDVNMLVIPSLLLFLVNHMVVR